ncbi:unnamed protein product [Fusarium graminearum]|uniref:Chromosome 4, complete genome n=1 Tax=Gibberella zeae (strain ATCC MYA-4620 / CBS 123657 / FGSC 9075 / NRRL 31084 / PH-1) TaxID=229533 RepID=I1S9S7_GIBZE|nr:hypothetical protein FGSG_13608 [Fusarium graminearum PH-1]ESU16164.1 hypothetical protein FGSG_13608 [Fusarium graminearum PH-1]CEF83756.1 unnamed protein product [Fusarium graminearum]CZS74309.1 unnamed protein product [Fusarium graminearum]|eukprot:XP_011328152.1 hypothetical protein FGSG_13608 [Fusarium graminearum PH-1]
MLQKDGQRMEGMPRTARTQSPVRVCYKGHGTPVREQVSGGRVEIRSRDSEMGATVAATVTATWTTENNSSSSQGRMEHLRKGPDTAVREGGPSVLHPLGEWHNQKESAAERRQPRF